MAIVVTDVIRVTAEMSDLAGGDVMNTYDLLITGGGTGGDTGFKEDVIDYLNVLYNNIDAYQQSGVSYDQVSFYHRNGSTAITPITWSPTPSAAGSGDALPAGTSLLILARTSTRRRVKRVFLGPFTEPSSAGYGPTGALQSDAAAFAADLLAPYTGGNTWTFHAVLWSDGLGVLPLVEASVSLNWAIQRRRRLGRGS